MLVDWIDTGLFGAYDGPVSLNWTEIVIAVSTGWAALIITLTALFAVIQIRHLRQTRSADTFQRLYMTIMERATDFLEFPRSLSFSDYSDYKRKYMRAEPDKHETVVYFGAVYNMIGHMVQRGVLQRDMVFPWVGPAVMFWWDKLEPMIEGYRREPDMAGIFGHFEWLYYETQQWAATHESELRRFQQELSERRKASKQRR